MTQTSQPGKGLTTQENFRTCHLNKVPRSVFKNEQTKSSSVGKGQYTDQAGLSQECKVGSTFNEQTVPLTTCTNRTHMMEVDRCALNTATIHHRTLRIMVRNV